MNRITPNSIRKLAGLGLVAGTCLAVSTPALAQPLSTWEQLSISDSYIDQARPAVARPPITDRFDTLSLAEEAGEDLMPGQFRTVVDVYGGLGFVLDYTSGNPRFRGLSLSSGDRLRIEADGRVTPNLDSIRGSLRLEIEF